jgi:hypothetical protein
MSKRVFVGIAMAKLGLSATGAYALASTVVGTGEVREVRKDRHQVLVLLKEAVEP